MNPITILDIGLRNASLCFEIHGDHDKYFNLVSDSCTSVNVHYTEIVEYLNIVDSVAVRAVDDAGQCRNIAVDLDGCSTSVDGEEIMEDMNKDGIFVRLYDRRVRISVPNCNGTITLVMWAICQTNTLTVPYTDDEFQADMIKFVIARGFNLNETSHGLLGE